MDKEEDVPVAEIERGEFGVDLFGEAGGAVEVGKAGQRELAPRIGSLRREVETAGLAIVRHPDIGAGKAQAFAAVRPETGLRIARGRARCRHEDRLDAALGLARIDDRHARRIGGAAGDERGGEDEHPGKAGQSGEIMHAYHPVRADSGRRRCYRSLGHKPVAWQRVHRHCECIQGRRLVRPLGLEPRTR